MLMEIPTLLIHLDIIPIRQKIFLIYIIIYHVRQIQSQYKADFKGVKYSDVTAFHKKCLFLDYTRLYMYIYLGRFIRKSAKTNNKKQG